MERQQLAGCVIKNDWGIFLLHRRGKFWEFPGGKIEGSEGDSAAARREGAEETGENVIIEQRLGSLAMTYINETEAGRQEKPVEYHYFKATVDNIPMAAELDVHDDARYFSHEELLRLYKLGELSLSVMEFMDSDMYSEAA